MILQIIYFCFCINSKILVVMVLDFRHNEDTNKEEELMKAIVHLEPKEFIETMYKEKGEMKAHPYVLDCGLAAMIYMFDGTDGNTYYLDRAFTACPEVIAHQDKYRLHADMYRKVALIH